MNQYSANSCLLSVIVRNVYRMEYPARALKRQGGIFLKSDNGIIIALSLLMKATNRHRNQNDDNGSKTALVCDLTGRLK